MQLFKGLRQDGRTWHTATPYHLPAAGEPGDWMPKVPGVLNPFTDGYHLYPLADVLDNLRPVLYTAEARGEVVKAKPVITGVIARQVRLLYRVDRWDRKAQVAFAAACVERVLPRFAERWPEDLRLKYAVKTARLWVNGCASGEDMVVASSACYYSEKMCETRALRFEEIEGLVRIAQAARYACVPVPPENEWWDANCLQVAGLCTHALWRMDGRVGAMAERQWQAEALAQLLDVPLPTAVREVICV